MKSAGRRVVLAAVAVVALVLLWRPLWAWLSGEEAPAAQGEARGSEASPTPAPAQEETAFSLSEEALDSVRRAFAAAEGARTLLARDSVEGLEERAFAVSKALQDAAAKASPSAAALMHAGAEAAGHLGGAKELSEARTHFASLSRALVALAVADPRLQEGWAVYSCPMAPGFNRWVQQPGPLANPYMGKRMLACGSGAQWRAPEAKKAPAEVHAQGDISHYTCPMHPSVRQASPGQCPLCGMDLTPVTRTDASSGVILVDEAARRRIGVQTAEVRRAPLQRSVRALGRVTYDETAVHDVTLKLDGYIEELKVSATGQPVKKGDVLFRLYSPELYAAQAEYLLARQGQSSANASLVAASRKRLQLWGLTDAQVAQLARRNEPQERVPFLSPASGFVLEKNVAEGAAVKAGERLFRIVPLERVWVEAEVYEQDLPRVKVGQAVEVTLPALPGRTWKGTVSYVYPTLEAQTRTGRVRVALANEELALKPDMFADVRFAMEAGERLQVPEEAVLYTGPRKLVFVDLGEGRLRPQEVELGLQGEGAWEVLSGLKAGDRVVTQGNFMLAAESRLRSSQDSELWGGGEHGAH